MNNKVIKVLNREHGRKVIEFFKQYCDTGELEGSHIGGYYGIINMEFDVWGDGKITEANAEIIELPEEKSYPRVMLVSEDNIRWKNRRVVFMEKCEGFLAWANAETLEDAEKEKDTVFWKYAKELEPIEITLEEIAKWKGTSKDQIIIKNECRKNKKSEAKRAFNVRGCKGNTYILPYNLEMV